MLKVTFRGILTHKIRFALTTLAIVLGVAFVAGTFVLTDTIGKAFDEVFDAAFGDIDITVQSVSTEQTINPISDSVVDDVLATEGVANAEGWVFQQSGVAFATEDGEQVSQQGPPVAASSWFADEALSPFKIVGDAGRAPQTPDEVVIDEGTADANDVSIGDRFTVSAGGGVDDFEVVGIANFKVTSPNGVSPTAFFDYATAQAVTGLEGQVASVNAKVASGGTPEEVVARLDASLGDDLKVQTGEEAGQEIASQIKDALGFFNTFLLVFAIIALFVGTFLIVNTFSIVVAQRSGELALLRAVGASRGQVGGSVVLEALLLGILASTVGLVLGVLVAIGLRALLGAFGLDLPTTGNVIAARTVILAFAIGIGVTLLSAIFPALRASSASPVAALRGETPFRRRRGVGRFVVGSVVLVLGIGTLLVGLFADVSQALAAVGFGALLTFVGLAVLAPLFVRPIVGLLGAPVPKSSVPGQLGIQNAKRNPRRTASTAAALMVGLGLAVFAVIFSNSIKASADAQIDEAFLADFIVQSGGQTGPPQLMSTAVAEEIADVDGVAVSAGLRGQIGPGRFGAPWSVVGDDSERTLFGVTFDGVEETTRLDVVEGEVAPEMPGLAVFEEEAEAEGWEVGDTLAMQFPTTAAEVPIVAIYADDRLAGPYALEVGLYDSVYPSPQDVLALVTLESGTDAGTVRTDIEDVAGAYPGVRIQDQTELKEENREQIQLFTNLVLALLFFAVAISLVGIVNTLALSIFERTREIGLLRAVGMTGRQTKRMITWESVIVTLLGAVLGLVIGTFFAWTVTRALADEGLAEFVFPVVPTIVFFLFAALAGVLAGFFPARRAARVDVLSAVTTE